MRITLPTLNGIALVLVLLIISSSCAKVVDEAPVPGDSGSSNDPADADNPPVGVVDDSAGFYVHIRNNDNYTYYVHKGESSFSTDCVANTGEQITCISEGEELDLYNFGATIQYNVPSNQCSYLYVMPYYYYYREAGVGPNLIQEDTDQFGAVGVDANNDGTIDGAVQTCSYDYTADDGPNCCAGTYSKVTRAWNATNSNYDITSTESNIEWGGKVGACLSGPAVSTNTLTTAGFPRATIYYVENQGLNETYEISAPLDKEKSSNVYVANYFDPTDHGGSSPTPVVQPYYLFRCLDRSYEVKSEIRFMIREWNTRSDFDDRVAAPTKHSEVGFEPSPFGLFPINDFQDWKDFLNSYPEDNE